MSYKPKTCILSVEELMDFLEDIGLVELDLGETLTSVKLRGDVVEFTFDVKEE